MNKSIKWILLILFIAAGFIAYAVFFTPSKAFHDPLSIAFRLSGNFGELRSNHFHMGLDVRTNGEENLSVYAVADGYVSRVIIEELSLGKAIFITHPDGHTTVYAHLNRFYDALETTVENKQYADRQPEQDMHFAPGLFPVEKGQLIAYSGNTGGSEAPHLHFEVRDTKTGNNLNPLLYGFDMDDEAPPVMLGLYWYNRRYSTYRTGGNSITLQGKDGHYQPTRDVIKVRSPLISLGIRAMDKSDDNRFRFGIYRAELRIDDSLVHQVELNDFSYDDSRYINACVDYTKWMKTGLFVQHLSRLPGNQLSVCKGAGLINLSDKRVHNINIRLYDVNNNVTTMEGKVQYSGAMEEPAPAATGTLQLIPGRESTIRSGQVIVHFSKQAFYDTVSFLLKEMPNSGSSKASALISLHNAGVPVHDDYTIAIKAAPGIPEARKQKIVMQLNTGKQVYTVKGKWEGDFLKASFNSLGTVQLLLDTVSPAVQTIGWKSGQAFTGDASGLSLNCTDGTGGIGTFKAELDGQWLLYDRKGPVITLHIPAKCRRGAHRLSVTVTDMAGNSTLRNFSFVKG